MKRKALRNWDKLASDVRVRFEGNSTSASSDDDVPQCPFSEKRRKHHHKEKHDRHHKEHGRRHHDRGDHTRRTLTEQRERQLATLESLLQDVGAPISSRRRCENVLNAAAGCAAGAANVAAAAASSVATERNMQYLRNIGVSVARLLDPLGIDVAIRPPADPAASASEATPSTSAASATTPMDTTTPSVPAATGAATTTTASGPHGNAPCPSAARLAQLAPQFLNPGVLAAALQQITEGLAQQHVDTDQGWVIPSPVGKSVSVPFSLSLVV